MRASIAFAVAVPFVGAGVEAPTRGVNANSPPQSQRKRKSEAFMVAQIALVRESKQGNFTGRIGQFTAPQGRAMRCQEDESSTGVPHSTTLRRMSMASREFRKVLECGTLVPLCPERPAFCRGTSLQRLLRRCNSCRRIPITKISLDHSELLATTVAQSYGTS